MAKSKKSTPEKTAPKKLPKSLRKGDLPRPAADVWAAGIGALAQARTTGGASFDALVSLGGSVVDRGTGAAKAAIGQVEQAAAAVAGTAKGVTDGALDTVQGGVEAVVEAALGRLGVPGRDEVLALRAQVDVLQAKVAALAEAEAGPPGPAAYEVAAHERGWAVRRVGRERATAVHPTKKEALRDARQTARAHAPATLTVYKADGTVAEETAYDA